MTFGAGHARASRRDGIGGVTTTTSASGQSVAMADSWRTKSASLPFRRYRQAAASHDIAPPADTARGHADVPAVPMCRAQASRSKAPDRSDEARKIGRAHV